RIVAAAEAPAGFHARFGATAKTYRYRLWTGGVMSPFERAYAWHVAGTLDVDRMAAAAPLVEGRHDFAAFQGAGSAAPATVREVTRSRIVLPELSTTEDTEDAEESTYGQTRTHLRVLGVLCGGGLIQYEITGDGFLRHMVRTIIGTLVEIGRGRRSVESMADTIRSRDRGAAGPTAPAEGLFLISVAYDRAAGDS